MAATFNLLAFLTELENLIQITPDREKYNPFFTSLMLEEGHSITRCMLLYTLTYRVLSKCIGSTHTPDEAKWANQMRAVLAAYNSASTTKMIETHLQKRCNM